MELTRDEMVAAEMASRNFNEIIVPIIDQLISNEAKKVMRHLSLSVHVQNYLV